MRWGSEMLEAMLPVVVNGLVPQQPSTQQELVAFPATGWLHGLLSWGTVPQGALPI